jgi:hypothetical protein
MLIFAKTEFSGLNKIQQENILFILYFEITLLFRNFTLSIASFFQPRSHVYS